VTTSYARGKKFADDLEHDGWDHETGMPTLSMVANAIQVWAMFQYPLKVTVRACGLAFNLDDAQVREAVEYHNYMYLDGPDDLPAEQTIEHDGE
jgi:hypothetical protein